MTYILHILYLTSITKYDCTLLLGVYTNVLTKIKHMYKVLQPGLAFFVIKEQNSQLYRMINANRLSIGKVRSKFIIIK